MRGMTDVILRDGNLAQIAWPVTVLVLEGVVMWLLGMRLFRSRYAAR